MLDIDALSTMIADIVGEEVGKAVTPLNAKIAELEARPVAEPSDVAELVREEVAKIPPPENGKDVDPEQVASLVAEQVERAVAALPAPQDGKSVTVEDVVPLIAEEVGRAVAALPVPKDGKDGANGEDGAGIADLLRDHEGNLVASFTDGRLKNLGPIQGKDGKDGRDGFQLEDFSCRVLDDDRTLELSFRSGEVEHIATLKWPTVIDRGVYKEGQEYDPGDGVTWGGQYFICKEPTTLKPDQSKDGKPWRLSVRKGRDGKDKSQ